VVREALEVLAAKGLVRSRQRRGTVVLPRESWNPLDGDILRRQGGLPPDFGFLERLAEVRAMVEPKDADKAGVMVEALLGQAARDLAEAREHAEQPEKPPVGRSSPTPPRSVRRDHVAPGHDPGRSIPDLAVMPTRWGYSRSGY
jgi:hypothetical protein